MSRKNSYLAPRPDAMLREGDLPFDSRILAGQLAPSSIRMYQRDFLAYLAFCRDVHEALDATTLARWRTHLAQATDKSPNTINRMLAAVRRLMKEAATQGYLSGDAALAFDRVEGVKVKALKGRTKPNSRVRISPTMMRQLCDAPDATTLLGLRDRALLHTLASSGVRISELASLLTSQLIERDGGCFVQVMGKNDVEPRDAPLSREARRHIQTWLAARAAAGMQVPTIFTGFEGRGDRLSPYAISAVGAWQVVQRYSKEVGLLDVKPHDFRRFVGTQLARADIRQAQKALGHKRIDTTASHYVLDDLAPNLTDELF